MSGHRATLRLTAALLLAVPLAASVGCGGNKNEVAHAQVQPGNMPPEGEWTGVYYSPTYGYLHLIKEGSTISGKWRTSAGDKWGELHGTVNGDLVKYEWQETTIGMVGPSAKKTGKGYFKYVIPKGDNVEHEIHGEWGLGANEAGQTWDAIKQRNMPPDPDSVMPDETQTVNTGWGEGGGSKSDSEEGGDDAWE